MWWLIPIGVGVLGKLLFDAFIKDAGAEKIEACNRWESKREEVHRSVEDHRRQIEVHLYEAQQSYDFFVLTEMHNSSRVVSDVAYKLLNDAKINLDSISNLIRNTKEKCNILQSEIDSTNDFAAKSEIIRNIKEIRELKSNLYIQKDIIKEQKESLYSEVVRLNDQTAQLKLFIRDRCGDGGFEWYSRLESRKKERRIAEGKPIY
jgi:hypothetical protein